jgi:hypothetical protein
MPNSRMNLAYWGVAAFRNDLHVAPQTEITQNETNSNLPQVDLRVQTLVVSFSNQSALF